MRRSDPSRGDDRLTERGSAPFRVPFIRPEFPTVAELAEDFQQIVEVNWFTNFGPRERDFADAISMYVGEEYHAVTFSNATIALIALLTTSLGRGDGTRSVIVASFTFAAGPEAIEWSGYRPLLVDLEPGSLQPSFASAQAALAERNDVAGILLTNTFGIGNPAIDAWESLAAEHGLPLLIDSAAGFGSEYPEGRRVGTAGDAEVFSFHATKPLAIGEGGAVVTRDGDLARRLREVTNFGFSAGVGATALGLNGKLQELNAAIGLRQLEKLDYVLRRRRDVLSRYVDVLGEAVEFPRLIERSSVCFATILLPSGQIRDRAHEALRRLGVEARVYYSPPVHVQPHFAGCETVGALSATEDVSHRALSVPAYQGLGSQDQDMIIDIIGAELRDSTGPMEEARR